MCLRVCVCVCVCVNAATHALTQTQEKAILDMEMQAAERPRIFFDVTVRHLPGNNERSKRQPAVNTEAENDKRTRYPKYVTPWKIVPLHSKKIQWCGPSGA